MKSWIYLLTTLWLLTACKADTEPEPETTQPVVPQHVAVTFNCASRQFGYRSILPRLGDEDPLRRNDRRGFHQRQYQQCGGL